MSLRKTTGKYLTTSALGLLYRDAAASVAVVESARSNANSHLELGIIVRQFGVGGVSGGGIQAEPMTNNTFAGQRCRTQCRSTF